MRRFSKSMLGVTLLEIMLVLAIAAMIIVMSVRYYQSATSSQQSNAVLQQVQALTAAADGLSQSSGSYAGVTSAAVGPLLPANGLQTPWGTTITITPSTSSYTVNIPGVPTGVCPLLVSKLGANAHYSALSPATAGACSGVGTVSYTYLANP